MEKNCTTCIYFDSFRDSYEDELEPDDQGFCRCNTSRLFGNEGAGVDECCDEHSHNDLGGKFLELLSEVYGSDVAYHEESGTIQMLLDAMYKAYNLDR